MNIKDLPIKGDNLLKISDEMMQIIKHFFSNDGKEIIPFRGFLLEGPPGIGKTELVKQTARIIGAELYDQDIKVFFMLVDSADIAAAKWGEAERKIKSLFKGIDDSTKKLIILFDDIDCLMVKRGANVAVEWHYSINSILFHELDKIKPSQVILIATSNRTDLIDDALRSRLYSYNIDSLSMEDLIEILKAIVNRMSINSNQKEKLVKKVIESLVELKEKIQKGKIKREGDLNIRDIQHFITKIYIKELIKY